MSATHQLFARRNDSRILFHLGECPKQTIESPNRGQGFDLNHGIKVTQCFIFLNFSRFASSLNHTLRHQMGSFNCMRTSRISINSVGMKSPTWIPQNGKNERRKITSRWRSCGYPLHLHLQFQLATQIQQTSLL